MVLPLTVIHEETPIKAEICSFVHWPVEVRLCLAGFLEWNEFVSHSLLCQSWRLLDVQDALWQVYFSCTWPRLARRKEASSGQALPWRALFRAHWASGDRCEDALEEDWLDFSASFAADDLGRQKRRKAEATPSNEGPLQSSCEASSLKLAAERCRKELAEQGLQVPGSPADSSHVCSSRCRFHRLAWQGDAFLCEASGSIHHCQQNHPCSDCVASSDECFLVCPVSGRCFPMNSGIEEEVSEPVICNDWDPELSVSQQIGRWFEQGYSMSEEQAQDFFGGGNSRRVKRPCLTSR